MKVPIIKYNYESWSFVYERLDTIFSTTMEVFADMTEENMMAMAIAMSLVEEASSTPTAVPVVESIEDSKDVRIRELEAKLRRSQADAALWRERAFGTRDALVKAEVRADGEKTKRCKAEAALSRSNSQGFLRELRTKIAVLKRSLQEAGLPVPGREVREPHERLSLLQAQIRELRAEIAEKNALLSDSRQVVLLGENRRLKQRVVICERTLILMRKQGVDSELRTAYDTLLSDLDNAFRTVEGRVKDVDWYRDRPGNENTTAHEYVFGQLAPPIITRFFGGGGLQALRDEFYDFAGQYARPRVRS